MKANQKYIEIGLLILIVIIGVCAYNFGYKPYAEKAEQLQTEIDSLRQQSQVLEEKLAKEEDFKTIIANADYIIEDVLKKYGPGYKFEKVVNIAQDIEDKTGISIDSISMTNPSVVYESVAAEGEDNSKDVRVKASKMNITFGTGYTAFKSFNDYINNYFERMNVDSFSLAYNAENGTISGNAAINLYGVEDSNHTYTDPTIENIEIGNDNIFTTYTVETEEEEDTEGKAKSEE